MRIMKGRNQLLDYLQKNNIDKVLQFSDGALNKPVHFPLVGVETTGAVLFADLPGYSKLASEKEPIECAYMLNHFFAWVEGEAIKQFGGVIDKYIGDEVMIIFLKSLCKQSPLESAVQTAKRMLGFDPYGFSPKIGIAHGPLFVGLVGHENVADISVIGSTVNLAARCVGGLERNTIRIASERIDLFEQIFSEDKWVISGPKTFNPKNMLPTNVVEIQRDSVWILNFDYFEEVKKNVETARKQGMIKEDF